MPQVIVLDAARCRPGLCPQGRCQARRRCPIKAIYQEAPYERPFLGGLCNGCAKCLGACPQRALRLG